MAKSTVVYFRRVSAEPIPDSTRVTFTVSDDVAQMTLAEFCDVPDPGFAQTVLDRARRKTHRGSTAPLFLVSNDAPDQSQQSILMDLLRMHAAKVPGLPHEMHAAHARTEYRKVGSWWEVLWRGEFALAWKNRHWREYPVAKLCITVYVISIADAEKLAHMYLSGFIEEFKELRAQIESPTEAAAYKGVLKQLILDAMNKQFYPNSFSVVEVDLR